MPRQSQTLRQRREVNGQDPTGPNNESDRVTIRGTIKRVFFSRPEFSAGTICPKNKTVADMDQWDSFDFLGTKDGNITFAGKFQAREGDTLILHGHWTEHAKYGRQLAVESIEYDTEMDRQGLANYLAGNPAMRGIGPSKARQIAEKFHENFDDVITSFPEAISESLKIPLPVIQTLREEWLSRKETNLAASQLAAYELTHFQIETLISKYGPNAYNVIQANPYSLIDDLDGFGFKRVDKIARKVGTPKDDPKRIRAGINFCVNESLNNGDCWLTADELIDQANTLLVMDVLDSRSIIQQALELLISEGHIIPTKFPHENEVIIAKTSILHMEQYLADVFDQAYGDNPHNHTTGEDTADTFVREINPNLADQQHLAVKRALLHSISVITGGAGTGKTHTISTIVSACKQLELSVDLAAPTGKAAKVIEHAVGHDAFTIHRLLGYDSNSFIHDTHNPIAVDVLIVDEFSMVDVPLAYHLFQAIDLSATSVVLVGDPHQLPPVGPGSVLRDIIQSEDRVPVTTLNQVFRQAGPLKENCSAILEGRVAKTADPSQMIHEEGPNGQPVKYLPWYNVNQFKETAHVIRFVLDLFDKKLSESMGFDLINDVQVLSPMKKGDLGTQALNIELQRALQRKLYGVEVEPIPKDKRIPLLLHDKVIQTRNNYKINVMNGAIGRVTAVRVPDDLPMDDKGLLRWLVNAVKIDRVKAEIITAMFSATFAKAIELDPETVAKKATVSRKDMLLIEKAWAKRKEPTHIIVDFGDNGRHQRVAIRTHSPEYNDLQLAYALTIHKVQGSQFPCVFAIIHKSHSFMHHRNLFYTAVTRAQKTAIILGDQWGIRNCAATQKQDKRRTNLSRIWIARNAASQQQSNDHHEQNRQSSRSNIRRSNPRLTLNEYCAILAVTSDASKDEIIKAHRLLAKKYHPDTGHGDEEKMKMVNQAKDQIFLIKRWM